MTSQQIAKKWTTANIPFELASQIRKLLDDAKSSHSKLTKEEWEEIETEVDQLVFGDDE